MRTERIDLLRQCCEGISTEALQKLAKEGGVLRLLGLIENVVDGDSQSEYVLADILKAVGPLEDENG